MGKQFRKLFEGNTIFDINPQDLCPCGSGIITSDCCLTERGLFKLSSLVLEGGHQTFKSLNGCYASSLRNCDGKLSREHYISKSLLDHISQNGVIKVSGLPWIGSESMGLSPGALASRILCQRHNSALSRLDDIAARLYSAFDESKSAGSNEKLLFLFSGHDVERWLLKLLCGLAASRNLPVDRQVEMSVPKQWLKILFGYTDFPDNQGLYFCNQVGFDHRVPPDMHSGPADVAIRAISNKDSLTGLGVYICGYEFILSMSGFSSRRWDNRSFTYRPQEFYYIKGDYEKSVLMSWQGLSDGGRVTFRVET